MTATSLSLRLISKSEIEVKSSWKITSSKQHDTVHYFSLWPVSIFNTIMQGAEKQTFSIFLTCPHVVINTFTTFRSISSGKIDTQLIIKQYIDILLWIFVEIDLLEPKDEAKFSLKILRN